MRRMNLKKLYQKYYIIFTKTYHYIFISGIVFVSNGKIISIIS
ncbi:hypothetical protein HMPREF1142_1166 [Peptostreptococcaceae bacterium AS15]|nr:hypothetical protein HMPREF1142_1166 [Peptostreptococcaceae bacterium AS15]